MSIDLDELGWDGSQDILMAGWIANAGFDYLSNQVFGSMPSGSMNIGPRDADSDGTNDLDFHNIAGDQFINLSNPSVPCPADLAAPFGTLNFFDIQAFIALFTAHDPAADLALPVGVFNIFDIQAYIAQYNMGCP